MEINIDENDLEGFNDKAKQKLKSYTEDFISDLIEEANRLESQHNNSEGEPEIVSGNVTDANVLVRKGLSKNKKSLKLKIARIFSALLALVVGAMYDSTKLQDGGYMLLFILVVALTIIMVTVSTILE